MCSQVGFWAGCSIGNAPFQGGRSLRGQKNGTSNVLLNKLKRTEWKKDVPMESGKHHARPYILHLRGSGLHFRLAHLVV